MTDLPDPNRPQTPSPSTPGIPPSWSSASDPTGVYPPYPSPLPPTDLPVGEAPPPPRRGPFGLAWPWWIAGGCAVLLLCCLCSMLVLALVAVANGRSTLPASPRSVPTPRVTPAPTAPARPSFSEDAPAAPAPSAPPQSNSASPTGTAALDFELSTLDGQKVRLSDFRGRPVVINFWATWCGPCLAEMPLLKQTYNDLKDTGLVLLAVDVQEKPDTVRKFAEKEQLPFTVLLDETGLVATYYRVNAYPTTFFVDPNGVIQSWQRGTLTKTTLDRHLDRIR